MTTEQQSTEIGSKHSMMQMSQHCLRLMRKRSANTDVDAGISY